MEARSEGIRIRMGLIAGLIVAGLLGVVARAYYLQTVRQAKLDERAAAQTSTEVELKAPRGEILDRNGVELAVTTDAPSVYAHPDRIQAPRRQAERIAPHLNVDVATLAGQLSSDRSFVWLERKVEPESAEAIEELDVPGVGNITEHKRYYPLGSRAGQLLGFVGIDNEGLEGLERRLDPMLAADTYESPSLRDARGRTIMKKLPDLQSLQGSDVVLTLDERVQRVTERALADQVEEYDAKRGYAVVMDVDNGDILAMANTPAFDPNRFQSFESSDWKLRPVTDTFEPGSIFKPFTLAGALQEGVVGLETTFDCEEGAMEVGGHVIHDTHAHERLTVAETIQKSSNICAYKIARRLGRHNLYDYIRDFGFGTPTGLGIAGERTGRVWPAEDWAEVTFANVAFGQGLSATPLQVATAMSAIANGGLLLEPKIVKEVRRPDGRKVREAKPTLVRRVVSSSVAEQTTEAMRLVTLEEGTGPQAALEKFEVAGKTGTAQQVDPETKQYGSDEWVASFVGFAPADDPEVLALVMIDEPEEMHYGGVVAAPAFRRIVERTLSLRGVQPAGGDADETTARKGESDDEAWSPSEPRAVESEESSERIGDPVPDFRGLTARRAVESVAEIGARPSIEGWGRVIAQRPRPGRPLGPERKVSLVLSPRLQGETSDDVPARTE